MNAILRVKINENPYNVCNSIKEVRGRKCFSNK